MDGKHLMLDVYVREGKIFDQQFLEDALYAIVDLVKMKMLVPPQSKIVPTDPNIKKHMEKTGEFGDSGGITSFCVLNKSHASLHWFELDNYISFDVYSCDNFEHKKVVEYIKHHFECIKN